MMTRSIHKRRSVEKKTSPRGTSDVRRRKQLLLRKMLIKIKAMEQTYAAYQKLRWKFEKKLDFLEELLTGRNPKDHTGPSRIARGVKREEERYNITVNSRYLHL